MTEQDKSVKILSTVPENWGPETYAIYDSPSIDVEMEDGFRVEMSLFEGQIRYVEMLRQISKYGWEQFFRMGKSAQDEPWYFLVHHSWDYPERVRLVGGKETLEDGCVSAPSMIGPTWHVFFGNKRILSMHYNEKEEIERVNLFQGHDDLAVTIDAKGQVTPAKGFEEKVDIEKKPVMLKSERLQAEFDCDFYLWREGDLDTSVFLDKVRKAKKNKVNVKAHARKLRVDELYEALYHGDNDKLEAFLMCGMNPNAAGRGRRDFAYDHPFKYLANQHRYVKNKGVDDDVIWCGTGPVVRDLNILQELQEEAAVILAKYGTKIAASYLEDFDTKTQKQIKRAARAYRYVEELHSKAVSAER